MALRSQAASTPAAPNTSIANDAGSVTPTDWLAPSGVVARDLPETVSNVRKTTAAPSLVVPTPARWARTPDPSLFYAAARIAAAFTSSDTDPANVAKFFSNNPTRLRAAVS